MYTDSGQYLCHRIVMVSQGDVNTKISNSIIFEFFELMEYFKMLNKCIIQRFSFDVTTRAWIIMRHTCENGKEKKKEKMSIQLWVWVEAMSAMSHQALNNLQDHFVYSKASILKPKHLPFITLWPGVCIEILIKLYFDYFIIPSHTLKLKMITHTQ